MISWTVFTPTSHAEEQCPTLLREFYLSCFELRR
jgi:hypothetical protein